MKISLILAHPKPSSFNHAIARSALTQLERNNHEVRYHDLYAEKFNPVLPFAELSDNAFLEPALEIHCREISTAEAIIIVHPNWWGQPPALLKGWVDRVFRAGTAYQFLDGDDGQGIPVGLLKAKTAMVFNTANTPADRETAVFGDPLETLWKNCIFGLCGVNVFFRNMFAVMITSSAEQRKGWLREVQKNCNTYFPED
jgi:NAD(P)H dehydrogenase (quinone)